MHTSHTYHCHEHDAHKEHTHGRIFFRYRCTANNRHIILVRKDLKTKNNYEHNKKHLSKLPQTQE